MDTKSTGASTPYVSARQFAARVEVAIVDLEERFPAGIGAVERALAERIRAALARLLDCAAQIETDGVVVPGSTGQPRQHQLLKTEQELRREIADALQQLAFRTEQGALLAEARAITRRSVRKEEQAKR
jgi:hypothetical protein